MSRRIAQPYTSDHAGAPRPRRSEPNDIAEVVQALQSLPGWAIRPPTSWVGCLVLLGRSAVNQMKATESSWNLIHRHINVSLAAVVIRWYCGPPEGLDGARAFGKAFAARRAS